MADLAGAPREIVDVDTGQVVGKASQTLYGTRTWQGHTQCPLLHAGQYLDAESGWAYNRYRYYHPHAGMYNAQDPLGVSPRVASAQGYVDHPAHWVDFFGLSGKGGHEKLEQLAKNVEQGAKGENTVRDIIKASGLVFDGQMTVKVDGVTSRIDFIVNRGG
ncbi:RHS repeat-associated core domain-containing protein, partial [Corynebacterium sp. HMSC29G08]|uniref:RHS repeat-associated core domain-containing protein n=1 Tax=Corynebacterium sp. HMSC29G08 TaxID=1581069 RepID=UPI00114CCDF8